MQFTSDFLFEEAVDNENLKTLLKQNTPEYIIHLEIALANKCEAKVVIDYRGSDPKKKKYHLSDLETRKTTIKGSKTMKMGDIIKMKILICNKERNEL